MEFSSHYEIQSYVPSVTETPASFSGFEPRETSIVPTETSALTHVPQDPYAYQRLMDSLAASTCAQKPRLEGGVSYSGPPEEQRMIDSYLKQKWESFADKQMRVIDGELVPNDVERQFLQTVDTAIDELGGQIHVDIAAPKGPVRMFDDLEKYKSAIHGLNKENDLDNPPLAIVHTDAGMLMLRQDGIVDQSRLTHERVHHRSNTIVTPLKSLVRSTDGRIETPARISTGLRYVDADVPEAVTLNESVTDMAAHRLSQRLGHPLTVSYPASDILLSEVVTTTAHKLGLTASEVEFALYRGMFGTDREGVEMVREALGPDRANRFFGMAVPEIGNAEQAADWLELPNAAAIARETVGRVAVGKATTLPIFHWQAPGDPKPYRSM